MTAAISRFDETLSRPFLSDHDVALQFLTNSQPLNETGRAQLLGRGVSNAAIVSDSDGMGGAIRSANNVFSGRFFDFAAQEDSDAASAYIACARDWRGNVSDIIAFRLSGRMASWLGREALLGAHNVLAPRFNEPLRVFPDPLAWLRGDRDGVVVIDWRRAAAELEDVTISVDDVTFGQTLRRRLTRPPPPIVVRKSAKAAA